MKTNQPLSASFNMAVATIARRILPCGFDVSPDAPGTHKTLVAHYETTGRVLVWSGASESTVFACRETNYAFRAWHDSKHILFNLPFTMDGEAAVMRLQQADIRALYDGPRADLFCAILEAEIIGQGEYNALHGGYPVNQLAFVAAYLRDAGRALRSDYGISPVGVN